MKEEMYYRPPSEIESFIVRVMHGCSHNKCTFCNTFRDIRCRYLPLDEIIATMEQDAAVIGPDRLRLVESIYLEGGDPVAMPTERLLEIMLHARLIFPAVRRLTCYATARQIVRKSDEELSQLARTGLRRVFVGLESGSDAILQKVNKGCTAADLATAALKLLRAGIELDVSMMLGIGSRQYSVEHALATARLINAIEPQCVRIRTFIPKEGTEIGEDYLAGRFILMTPHEILRELSQMVAQIKVRTQLLSEHWSNFVLFNAFMPGARENLLAYISEYLAMPESGFRKIGIDAVRS